LQSLFFPEGLTFDGTAFNRTKVTGCAFSYLEQSVGRLGGRVLHSLTDHRCIKRGTNLLRGTSAKSHRQRPDQRDDPAKKGPPEQKIKREDGGSIGLSTCGRGERGQEVWRYGNTAVFGQLRVDEVEVMRGRLGQDVAAAHS
jgi:hypothetical protein